MSNHLQTLEQAREALAGGDIERARTLLSPLSQSATDEPRALLEARLLLGDILIVEDDLEGALETFLMDVPAGPGFGFTRFFLLRRAIRLEVNRGRFEAAHAHAERLEKIGRDLGWQGVALAGLEWGGLHLARGQHALAIHHATAVLKKAHREGYPDLGAAAALVAGRSTAALGQFGDARRFFTMGREAVEAVERSGYETRDSPVELPPIKAALELHGLVLALETFDVPEDADAILTRHAADPAQTPSPLAALASALLAVRRGAADADAKLALAAESAEAAGAPTIMARARVEEARRAASIGARRALLTRALEGGEPGSAASRQVRVALAEVELAGGDVKAASSHLDALDSGILLLHEQSAIARLRAQAALFEGDGDRALGWLEVALRVDETREHPVDLGRDHLQLAALFRRAEAFDRARHHLEQARDLPLPRAQVAIEACWQALVTKDAVTIQEAFDALVQVTPTPDLALSYALATAACERTAGHIERAPALLRRAYADAEHNSLELHALAALLGLDAIEALTDRERERLDALLLSQEAERRDILARPHLL